MSGSRPRSVWVRALVVLLTAASVWASAARLRVSGDLTSLFPREPESAALARYVRVFGGGDLGMVLVRADDADEARAAADEVARDAADKPTVAHVIERAPAAKPLDPTLAWRYAGPAARARLASALTDDGMRARLADTRAMLLAPGAANAEETLARDPLRLASIPFEARAELAAGVGSRVDDPFTADEGRARLVLLAPRGNAFDSKSAAAFVDDVDAVFAAVRARHPRATLGLAGGHAIARATEELLRRDLTVSGTLSLALAAGAFLLTFRRARALAAVLPPLALGTAWTMGIAALVFHGLSAIAIGFAAVVVGVGVDTGVHVYSALLDGRRAGLAPHDAAAEARRVTWRPTMVAALVAGVAFASLAWSDLEAMAELGILCGLGEVLTAAAILVVTPEIGAWIEKGAPPADVTPRWIAATRALTATRPRALAALGIVGAFAVALAAIGWPQPGDQLVAIRPKQLAPLAVSDAVYAFFGGRPGQWIVVSTAASRDEAAARSDAIAEALEPLASDGTIDGFDALSSFAPSAATQRARLAARDALDLPAAASRLEKALVDTGFDPDACAPALAALRAPSHDLAPMPAPNESALGWLVARHLQDDAGGSMAVTYVRPVGDPAKDARAMTVIRAADPRAVITGYGALEQDLRASLAHDLPRIALLALVLVALGLRAALGKLRDVGIALLALAAEIAVLGVTMRALGVRWHVYDALVVPVLIGITIDEAMFLLYAARGKGARPSPDEALRAQGSLVASTALTTAAGFAALVACRFGGLRDLGEVGAIGTVAGLVAALVVVPAGLRLSR